MGSVHMLSEVGQAYCKRRDNTIVGVRETSTLEARGYDSGTVSRLWSPRVGSEPVFPLSGSVSLKRHERAPTEWDFLHKGVQKLSIK